MHGRRLVMAALGAGLMWIAAGSAAAEEAQAAVRQSHMAEGLLGSFSLSGQGGPIEVRADSAEFSYRELVLRYRGDVVVTQGDLTLRSNVLRITLAAAAGGGAGPEERRERIREIVAEGEVQIQKGSRSASGGRAVFSQADRTVVLSDGAVLIDGPNRISGERVVVYLDENRSFVDGGERRVQAVLYPESGGDAGDAVAEAQTSGAAVSP